MARALAVKAETGTIVLEAAKKVLRQNGYSRLSTRDVAAAAGVPLSQIHYHFGSKQGHGAGAVRVSQLRNCSIGRPRCSATPRSSFRSNGTGHATISTTTSLPATCASCRN